MAEAAAAGAFLDREAPQGAIGVAVSGGGDSVALLLMVQSWAAARGRRIEAATVDHGLRPESGAEADAVARLSAARGIAHEVLLWQGWDGRGNLQAAAREARFALLGDWARRQGLSAICLGHTLDDQAETVLMRLARGSGVDGLSAMAPARRQGGMLWLRPLLGARRTALRTFLRAEGVTWAEDPSNEDEDFDRIKARRAMEALAPLGITAEGLAETATRLGQQRRVLDAEMARLAALVRQTAPAGAFRLKVGPLIEADPEIAMRLLADTLLRVAGRVYRPRGAALARLLGGLDAGASLHGCLIRAEGGTVLVQREPAAMAAPVPYDPAGTVWDGRFHLSGPGEGEVGPLGESDIRFDAPRLLRLTAPALWREGEVLSVPDAGFGLPLRCTALAHQELPEAAFRA